MTEELKKELDDTLEKLTRSVDSCREALNNRDTKKYKRYVNEIRFWADAVVTDWFNNFVRYNDNV